MSEHEVNEDLDPEAAVSDGEIHQSDRAEEGEIDPSESEKDDATAGDEAKVINKGKAKLIISGVEEARKEAGETKVIAPEPRVAKVRKPLPEPESERRAEEIQRLEREVDPGKERIKVDKANFENRKKRPDEAEIQEEQWGGGLAPGWWVMIAGACVAVVLLGGLALESWIDGDHAQTVPTAPPRSASDVDPYAGSPEKLLHERGGLNSEEVNNLLKAFMSQEDDVARSKFVRNPKSYLEKVGEWNVKLTPRLGDIEKQSITIDHTEDTAFIVLKCKDSEFMPFRAYFVREGEQLKFDWEATVAWSEASFEIIAKKIKAQHAARKKTIVDGREENLRQPQLPVKSPKGAIPQEPMTGDPVISQDELFTKPLLVRCLISRRDEFYTGPYNDREHSVFMLLSPDKSKHLWAYTDRDSALDIELRRFLDHGRFVMALKKNRHVTLRIQRNQKEALPSQVELVEIVHPEWVTP